MASSAREGGSNTLLELQNVNLYYDTLKVLKDINIRINRSEVHAIVGEHGAGKTSLCMILSGFLRPYSGKLILEGKTCDSLSPRKALTAGIELVTQHNPVVDNFSVAENLYLDNRGVSSYPFINRRKYLEMAQASLEAHGFAIRPEAVLRNMKLSDRVLVDILKHLVNRPRLLILDEALQKLTAPNCAKMIQHLKELKKAGMSIIFVTHRIDDIYNFADKVSILRNGEILITDSVSNIDKINLIKLAYTQISSDEELENANQEFYHLLKYNEAVLKQLPVNLVVVDRNNSIKLINEYAKKYFEIEETNYLNTPVRELFSFENRAAFDLLQGGLSSRNSETFYGITLNRNGVESITNIKTHPIYDESFRIGYYIIVEDITEREKLREQVILSEKLASVGLLSAGVAHEINNPLEIIYNYVRYLKFHTASQEIRATVNSLEEELKSISQIVSNLISFSDSSKNLVEQVDVNELIASILNLVEYNARYRRIFIHFHRKADPLPLRINKTEMKQVILNLIKNSFEAMPSGGHLTVATGRRKQGETRLVEIVFQDTGCGIGDRKVNDIFLPFYSTKKDGHGNLGLGLSVSYGIIRKYHGTITVRNRDGAGCEFTIRVPQAQLGR